MSKANKLKFRFIDFDLTITAIRLPLIGDLKNYDKNPMKIEVTLHQPASSNY